MNCYRVTLTVFSAESFVAEVDAMDEDHARRFGEESAERQYPDASEIQVDEVELLTPEPEPNAFLSAAETMAMKHAQVAAAFDELTKARGIIAGLLEAAEHGTMYFDQTDEWAWAKACAKIKAARAFLATKEPTP